MRCSPIVVCIRLSLGMGRNMAIAVFQKQMLHNAFWQRFTM